MKYAHYNNQGDVLGFYDDTIHESLPSPHLSVKEKEWQQCMERAPELCKVDVPAKKLRILDPSPPSLDDLKDVMRHKVYAFFSKARAKLAGYADPYKLAGWNDKMARAQRVLAGAASDADRSILQSECNKRGKNETPQQLAQKQTAKGQILARMVAIVDGMEEAALNAIESKRSEKTLSALLEKLQKEAEVELKTLLGE